jgi:hypothetical protein
VSYWLFSINAQEDGSSEGEWEKIADAQNVERFYFWKVCGTRL